MDTPSSGCDAASGCGNSAERLLQGEHFESTGEVSVRDVTAGRDGRVGIGGYYKGSLRSAGTHLSLADAATEDGFVAVYTTNGGEQWALPLPGFGSQGVTGVAFAPNGDLAAQAFSDPKRDAQLGEASGTAFVMRFDPKGEVNVRKGFSGKRTFAAKVAVDSTGAGIAVGSFIGQFDFYGLQPTLPPYVIKLDSDGNVIWIRDLSEIWAGPGNALAAADLIGVALDNLSVSVDATDAISIAGDVHLGQNSAFLVKLEPDGSVRYDVAFTGNATVHVNGVAADRDGSSIVAGDFHGDWQLGAERLATEPDAAGSDAWVAKLSQAGELEWVKTFSGNGGGGAAITAVATDPDGNVVVAGTADTIAIEDESFRRRDASSQVAFVAKLTPNGDKRWAYRANCAAAHFYALAIDADSKIWAGGEFDTELDFGPAPTAALGHPDAFLFQLRP